MNGTAFLYYALEHGGGIMAVFMLNLGIRW